MARCGFKKQKNKEEEEEEWRRLRGTQNMVSTPNLNHKQNWGGEDLMSMGIFTSIMNYIYIYIWICI